MSSAITTGQRPRMVVSRTTKVLVWVAVIVGSLILMICSHPAGPAGLALLGLPVLGMGALVCWLIAVIDSAIHRRFTAGLVIAPLIAALTIGLVYTATASKVRFVLLDRPGFNAIVRQAPAPTVTLYDRDLTEDEAYDTYNDFPGPCPSWIGTLHIRECASFSAGYLFYDWAGSGFIDDGGLAYLPQGAPTHDVGNGSFEHPDFWHFHGPWYAFASSW